MTNRLRAGLTALALACAVFLPRLAEAQTSPGLTYGQKLTPAQWNALFAAKQDTLGYVPLNSGGGVMTGRLVTAGAGAATAGFNIPQGSVPLSPVNGDMWITSTGVYAQVNGVTVGPLAGASPSIYAATSPLSVTFPAGVITYACTPCGVTTSALSQFAATTSLQLAGVISDETGTGALVFGTAPTIGSPVVTGTATIPAVVGGSAAGSTVSIQSTSSGTPSGDAVNIKASSINLGTATGAGVATVNIGAAGASGGVVTIAGGTSGSTTLQPSGVASGVLTLPAVTDTLAGKALANGGTNASLVASLGGMVYSTGSALAILSGTATANQIPMSGASSAPSWSTATYPATTTADQLLYSSAANTITGLATANNGVLVTSAGGVPSISSTLPSAVQGNITSVGTVAGGTWNGSIIDLAHGGTNANLTASVGGIIYSTASAGAVLSGTATASLPLLSGSSAAPSWAAISYPTSATSGGIPYFSSASAISSSGTLASGAVVLGGGAGGAPTSLSCATATTVLHGGSPVTCGQVVNGDIATNTIANASLAQAGAATFKGNPTAALANEQDFTIQGLPARGAPDAANDKLPLYDNATGTLKYVTPAQVASSATAGVSSIAGNTGAFTLSTGITNSANDIRLDLARNNAWTGDQEFASGRPWCDIRGHGATGGNATLDTAGVTACITALVTLGGGTMFVPPSSTCYLVNAINATKKNNIIVKGAGKNSCLTINGVDAASNWWDLTGSNGWKFQDLSINNNGTTVPKVAFLWACSGGGSCVDGTLNDLLFDNVGADVKTTVAILYAYGFGAFQLSGNGGSLAISNSTWRQTNNGPAQTTANANLRNTTVHLTATNDASITSANQTIGTGLSTNWGAVFTNFNAIEYTGAATNNAGMILYNVSNFLMNGGAIECSCDRDLLIWHDSQGVSFNQTLFQSSGGGTPNYYVSFGGGLNTFINFTNPFWSSPVIAIMTAEAATGTGGGVWYLNCFACNVAGTQGSQGLFYTDIGSCGGFTPASNWIQDSYLQVYGAGANANITSCGSIDTHTIFQGPVTVTVVAGATDNSHHF